MDFIGRNEEIKAINRLLDKDGFQAGIIYGRRRLGKTELLKHTLLNKNVPCIFFQCNLESEVANTTYLTKLIKSELNIDNLYFDSFIEAIEFVFKYSIKNRLYFVIDEYPYIRKIVPSIDSHLQQLIDSYEGKSNIIFFICGSSISTMKDIQSENNPLYRRFSLSILLKEMDYYDSSMFYKDFSNEDKVRLYAAFGGSPYYNKQIDSKLTVKDNIINLLSGSYSHLKDDVSLNLKEEISKINNANAVFRAIAEQKAFHFNDILSKAHIESSPILSDCLNKLMNMDVIEYIAPINDKKNKQKSGYRLSDNSLRFFYRYIYPNISVQLLFSDESFYDLFINDDFESNIVPLTFETIAKQYLIRLNRQGKNNPTLLDIGTYYYDDPIEKKNGQFDVAAKINDGYILYEVKFSKSNIDMHVINEEISQSEKTEINVKKYGFFSRSGFNVENNNDYLLYSLEDIYKIDE